MLRGCPESESVMQRVWGAAIAAALLAGCAGASAPAQPATRTSASMVIVPATTTASLSPTATPLPTETPVPSPTSIPVPVWRILFTGFSCETRGSECAPFDDTHTHYYAINSDGMGLEQMQTFPTPASPPEGSPSHYLIPLPQLSPDRSLLAYVGEGGFYLSDMQSGETRLLFQPKSIPGAAPKLGPFCWTPDGLMIKFNVKHQENGKWLDAFYMINLKDKYVQPLFTITGLGGLMFAGACSPDGRELAFSIPESSIKGKAGLYAISLDNGEWQQILNNYYVWVVRTAPVENLP